MRLGTGHWMIYLGIPAMRIEEVHIEQFGELVDRRIDAFGLGLTVLYGRNEAGKTSLLEFIRRTLFGYPDKRSKRAQYSTVNDRPAAGSLLLRLQNNQQFRIYRRHSGRGEPEIEHKGEVLHGETALQRYLGSIPESLFSRIYAIGLDELHNVNSLQINELKGMLFGAGTGVGDPMRIKAEFCKEKEALYSKTARKRTLQLAAGELKTIDKQIKDARAQVAGYDELHKRLKQEEESVASLRDVLRQCNERLQYARMLSKIYSEFITLRQLQHELSELEPVDELPESLMAEVERLQNEKHERVVKLASLEENIIASQSKLASVAVDEPLIAARQRIESLNVQRESYANAAADVPGVKADRKSLVSQIHKDIAGIDRKWTVENITGFSLEAVDRQIVNEYSDRFKTVKHHLEMTEGEAKRASLEAMARTSSTKLNVWILRSLAMAAILGTAFGAWQANWWLAGFSLLMLVALGTVLLVVRNGKGHPAQNALADEVAIINEDYSILQDEWGAIAERFGFHRSFEPDTVRTCVETIKSIQKDIERLNDIDSRIARMEEKIEAVEAAYKSLLAELGTESYDADFSTGIAVMTARLREHTGRQTKRSEYRQQLDEAMTKKSIILEQEAKETKALQALLNEYDLSSYDAYLARIELCEQKRALIKSIADSEAKITQEVGFGKHLDDALAFLDKATPEELKEEAKQLEAEYIDLEKQIDDANSRRGGLRENIKSLQSREDISALMLERECQIERFNRLVEKYVVSHTAEFVLGKAVTYHERHRQPEVILRAGAYFSELTCGKYVRLLQSMEDNEIQIVDSADKKKSVDILSRGTREQLYLAIRLAAIEEFEQHAEPMPLIVDDILVNFDSPRQDATARTLVDFARRRQVLTMTCHSETRDRFVDLGADLINLSV